MEKHRQGFLAELAVKYGSDKHGHHYYCGHYQKHFEHLSHVPMTILEIGIGGEGHPKKGGSSLKMWKDFFTKGRIFGVDIYDKSFLNSIPRIKTFKGSQDDEDFLHKVLSETGAPDIIIDDASHINPLTIKTFELLFSKLKFGGIYVIEDLETSWWPDLGFAGCRDPHDFTHPSAINLVRNLLNEVNRRKLPSYAATYPIASLHCYDNMVVICKEEA